MLVGTSWRLFAGLSGHLARLRALFHFLVLFFAFLVNGGRSQAALRGQVADEVHDVPHLLVIENALPSRHSSKTDSVFYDPLQLPVGIFLHVLFCQIGNCGRHFVGKWHAGVVTVEPMTDLAVVLEMRRSFFYALRGV